MQKGPNSKPRHGLQLTAGQKKADCELFVATMGRNMIKVRRGKGTWSDPGKVMIKKKYKLQTVPSLQEQLPKVFGLQVHTSLYSPKEILFSQRSIFLFSQHKRLYFFPTNVSSLPTNIIQTGYRVHAGHLVSQAITVQWRSRRHICPTSCNIP